MSKESLYLDLNTTFDLLRNDQRRCILNELHQTDDSAVSLETLISEVSEVVETPRQSIETEIRHVHLPKLRDNGVVEYDPRTEMVRYFEHEPLGEHLALAREYNTTQSSIRNDGGQSKGESLED
ncbi:DUF7344 domain-containing protein [Haladaptatus caseinilyticus]